MKNKAINIIILICICLSGYIYSQSAVAQTVKSSQKSRTVNPLLSNVSIPESKNNMKDNDISSNSPICEGETLILNTTYIPGAYYAWTGPNGFMSGEQNFIIPNATINNSGVYNLTIFTGDTAIFYSTIVVVNSTPTSTFYAPPTCGSIPPNNINWTTLIYNGTYETGATFLWQVGGSPQPSGTYTSIGPHQVWWYDVASTTIYNITLTVTNPSGCPSTTIQQILIFPSSSVTVGCCINPLTNAGLDFSICGLTAQFSGSVNPSTLGTWTKTGGPAGTIIYNPDEHTANATVTVSQPGVYTFEWAEVSGSCDSSDYVTINFLEAPEANAGYNQVICGNTIYLDAMPYSGSSHWSCSDASVTFTDINDPYAMATVQHSGLYTFFWNLNNGTCFVKDSVNIIFALNGTQVPTPTITIEGNDSICFEESVVLTSSPGYSYHWLNGATTQSITVDTTGTYALYISDSDGCISNLSNSVTITVFPLPPFPIATHEGNVLSSSNSTGNQWYYLGSIIPGATEQNYTAVSDGYYFVMYTDSNGCSSQSNVLNMFNTDIPNTETIKYLRIFPNPVSEKLIIENQSGEILQYEIRNVIGDILTSGVIDGKAILNMKEYANGMYFIKISSKEYTVVKRIVKQ